MTHEFRELREGGDGKARNIGSRNSMYTRACWKELQVVCF